MRKNGFTLVELMAVIFILGLITIMTVSSVVKLEENNAKTNFEYYGTSLIEGTKIYISKYEKNLSWNVNNDYLYTTVTYNNLKDVDFIKDYTNKKYKCNTASAKVWVLKCKNNTFKYYYTLTCTKKADGQQIYNKTFSFPTSC